MSAFSSLTTSAPKKLAFDSVYRADGADWQISLVLPMSSPSEIYLRTVGLATK